MIRLVLYAVISATSYYQFRGSTPFEIACGSYSIDNSLRSTMQLILIYVKYR